jgi:hypothetical protein
MGFELAMREPLCCRSTVCHCRSRRSAEKESNPRTQAKACATKKAPRLAAAPLQNQTRIGPRLLGLFGGFLVGLLGFLCHENLLPSFSRLLQGQAKRRNRHAARCNCYTGASGKCQENFGLLGRNRDAALRGDLLGRSTKRHRSDLARLTWLPEGGQRVKSRSLLPQKPRDSGC